VLNASLAYDNYAKYRAGIELRLRQQGSNTIVTPHRYGIEAASLSTPSGANPIETRVVHLFGSWNAGRFWGVTTTLGGDVSFIDVRNIDHVLDRSSFNVQFVARVSLTF
jgi:hypothetical protein